LRSGWSSHKTAAASGRPVTTRTGRAQADSSTDQNKFDRVMTKFHSFQRVLFSEIAAAVAKYGTARVMVLRVVMPFKCKVDSDGDLIKRAMRITVAQTKEHSLGENGFSANMAPHSVKVLANRIVCRPSFTMKTLELSGAYFFDTLPCLDTEGGIVYFTNIPEGWEFGYGFTDTAGRPMCLRVRRAMPGLIIA
jgi:hypothetical protein